MTLVFGRNGQVARALAVCAPDAVFLGRAQADLEDPQACARAIHDHAPRAVINAAAYTAVDRAEQEEALALQVNGAAPVAMAQACAQLGIPFVHLSTDYVFDGAGQAAFTSTHPTAPLGAYGRSKVAGEEGVRAAGGVHVILRTSWVFSAHGSNFVKTMLRLGLARDSLRVVADQFGGPTSARAVATACLGIAGQLQSDPQSAGTYHLSGTPTTSWAGFARAIMATAGLPCEIEECASADYPTAARRPLNSRLECAGLDRFGLRQPDWRADLAQTLCALKGMA